MNQTTDTNMDQQLRRLVEDWAAAELHGDTAFLEQTLADDFIAVGPRGFLLTKSDWLDRHQSRALRYQSFTLDDAQTRTYGDTALLIGRQSQTGTYQDHDIQGQFRATLVWTRQQGSWRLAGLHLSQIAPPPSR